MSEKTVPTSAPTDNKTGASAGTQTAKPAAPIRAPQRRGGGGHGPFGGGMPGAKAMDFKGSSLRLIKLLAPEKIKVLFVLILGIIGVTLNVIGPKILGNATNYIFGGMLGKGLPAGMKLDQLVDALNQAATNPQALDQLKQAAAQGGAASGDFQSLTASRAQQYADMLDGMKKFITPGAGIDFTQVGKILLVVLAIYVVGALFMFLQSLLVTFAVQRTMFRLRQDVETKLSRLPLKYFDGQPHGEILSRVTNDIDNIGQTLQQTFSQLISSVLTILGVLIMMLTISPILTLIAIVALPLAAVVTGLIMKRSQPQFIAQWKHTGELNGHIEEMFTGHALVKVFGHQETAEKQFDEYNDGLYNAAYKAQFISGIAFPAMNFVTNLSYVFVAVVGGLQVASGQLSLGGVQAFIQYSRQFTQPIGQIGSMLNLMQSGVASAERVFELLDADEQEADPAAPVELPEVKGRVEFEHVKFSYDPDTELIRDLSLVARPGQTVAIVGPTGAGKTTLVNLLMRFYEIDDGRILLDGVNTKTMSREGLRSHIGMVLQDTWLFNGSIRDNIAYGKLDATDEQVHAAAEATYVDRFVHSLPEGYDTVVDEEGSNVSAGEKQLLTIARAFLANPEILILDEATSSVDTRTEVLVQEAMAALRKNRTSFVIAHRLSTIRDADIILVMEHGDIVEQGNHDELMAADGAYARLYQSQFAGAAADVA